MSRAPKVTSLASHRIKDLGLSPEVEAALSSIQAEIADAYRENFVEMVRAINRQASALDRIQNTLRVLVEQLPAAVRGNLPPAIRLADDGEDPDLASAVIVADPIGAGYTLSQSSLARALDVPATDVSVLVRAFKIDEDGACAVVIRGGSKFQRLVNYHPRTIDRFRELVLSPPPLDATQRAALKRVRVRMRLPPGRHGA